MDFDDELLQPGKPVREEPELEGGVAIGGKMLHRPLYSKVVHPCTSCSGRADHDQNALVDGPADG